jgi:hypothetical protein
MVNVLKICTLIFWVSDQNTFHTKSFYFSNIIHSLFASGEEQRIVDFGSPASSLRFAGLALLVAITQRMLADNLTLDLW